MKLAAVCCVTVVALMTALVARDYPMVGHDHRYYVPRLLDTELHVRNNGYLSVQWYTPSFGGGLPAFPNPQHLQHTILQLLTGITDPWRAILITTACVSVAGFFAFRQLLIARLGVATVVATFGAVLFIANGFYIEHLIVGHVGYQLFPLAAVILLAVSDPRGHYLRAGAVIALVLTAMLFHAGIYLIILVALTTVLVLPLLALAKAALPDPRRMAAAVATALVLMLAISAAKLHAVMAFIRQFPREIADVYDVSLLSGLVGLALQLTGVMTVAPMMVLVGVDPARLEGALSRLTGADVTVGIWELDTGLSAAAWVALGAGVLTVCRRWRAIEPIRLTPPQTLALIVLATGTWIMIEATLARGIIYPVLKPLPILRSLHVNHRIASVFLVPLIVLAVLAVNRWQTSRRGRYATVALLLVALASPLAYFLLPARVHQRSFDVSTAVAVSERTQQGESLRVTRIADVGDAEALALGASSYRPYEPLFGYDLRDFSAQITPGDVKQVHGGAFNLTNPVSLVFPRDNTTMPFERIRLDEEQALDTFVRRGPTPWRPPAIQSALTWLSLTALVLTIGLVLFAGRLRHG